MSTRTRRNEPPVESHWKKSTLVEEYWVPEHAVRRQSSLFLRNKKLLRDTCRLPCWICGAAQSKLNPLEVHHVFEWALWNAMDHRRVTAILEVLEFYEEGYLATAGCHRQRLEEALAAACGPLAESSPRIPPLDRGLRYAPRARPHAAQAVIVRR